MVEYNKESYYRGEYSSFNPDSITGYNLKSTSGLGYPGSPQTSNQVGETVNALKQGVKAFEVTMLNPESAETIPKQHFKEMRQLMKMAGVKPSVHGPLIDAAGFTERGWGGQPEIENNKRRMFESIEKAYELDKKGNIPIVFHSSNGIPGATWTKSKDGEVNKRTLGIINQETGQIQELKEKEYFTPLRVAKQNTTDLNKAGYVSRVDDQIKILNDTEWHNTLTELSTQSKNAEDVFYRTLPYLQDELKNGIIKENKIINKETGKEIELDHGQREAISKIQQAQIFNDNIQLTFHNAFEKAFKYGSNKQREELKNLARDYSNKLNYFSGDEILAPINYNRLLQESIQKLNTITTPKIDPKTGKIDSNFGSPKVYEDVEVFALDKTADTFGDLAIRSYDKFKKGSPMIAIENMYEGMAFSRGDQMKEIVDKSREKFTNWLINEKRMDKKKAEEIANEKIGMTWDVGHLNIMKKSGFNDEDLVKETQKVKDYVKHIHLTDNFGYADTHLPPGMGNVPFKQLLEELEKNGQYKNMRKIIEAGNFVKEFKSSPYPLSLSALGSPIYGLKSDSYWGQTQGLQGGYFGGQGAINPQMHHSIYGAGFTTLPMELGGVIPGEQSRFSGDKIS